MDTREVLSPVVRRLRFCVSYVSSVISLHLNFLIENVGASLDAGAVPEGPPCLYTVTALRNNVNGDGYSHAHSRPATVQGL